tara:strand:- start:1680 stop:2036 length:357 start_codon:yes stop_codon:yes gene_type:complete
VVPKDHQALPIEPATQERGTQRTQNVLCGSHPGLMGFPSSLTPRIQLGSSRCGTRSNTWFSWPSAQLLAEEQSDSSHVAIVAIADIASCIREPINSTFITGTATELPPMRHSLLKQTL